MSSRTDLHAAMLEYEHALEHVAEHHDGPACPDCQVLAQSALDGLNRADFTQIARDGRLLRRMISRIRYGSG
jgi:hypothetical protein